jgi:S1-C subfamily serine protease
MNKNRVASWMVVLSVLLIVAAIAGGGIAYAKMRADKSAEDPSEAGIVIAAVASDGPAAEAGVVRGDILLKINDQAIDHPEELQRYLDELDVGDEVELTVLHGDDERILTATLGEQSGLPYLGLAPCDRSLQVGRVIALSNRLGAVITKVVPDGPADKAGLKEGDLVVAVDGQQVDRENSLTDLIAAHKPGDRVTLEVQRPDDDEPLEIGVTLDQHPDDEDKAFLGVSYLTLPHIGLLRGETPVPEELPIPWPFEGKRFVFPPRGALINQVEQDSPATEAGLQEGDIITVVDGEAVESAEDLVNVIADHKPGDTLTLTLHRINEDKPMEVEVTLGQHPDDEDKAYLGVQLEHFPLLEGLEEWLPSTDQPFLERKPFVFSPGADVEQGAVIRDVAEDSPADEAGLQEGDVITAINGEPIDGPSDLVDAVAARDPGDTMTLTIQRPDEEDEREVQATLSEHPDKEGQAYLGVTIGAFFRVRHFEGESPPEGMEPFFHFDFDELPFDWDRDDDSRPRRFQFRIQPDKSWDEFEFHLPPAPFELEEEPCCSGDSVL